MTRQQQRLLLLTSGEFDNLLHYQNDELHLGLRPFKILAESHIDGSSPKNLASSQGTKQIVIVDDEPSARNMLQTVLKLKGFSIVAALSDGVELLEWISGNTPKPDVILLDERMPKMSGIEACKILRLEYPGIAVVFVSADDSAEGRAMEAGAKAFLRKPISIPNLVLLISSL